MSGELYVPFRRASRLFDERGAKVRYVWVGKFATSMEMAGASISLPGLDPLVSASATTPFFKHVVN